MTEPRDVAGHLQRAAQELIAAARDALDVADELVSDRIRLMSFVLGDHAPSQDVPPKVERIEVERIEVERIEVERIEVERDEVERDEVERDEVERDEVERDEVERDE